jgi:pectinesterase
MKEIKDRFDMRYTFLLCFFLPLVLFAKTNELVVAKDGSGQFSTVQAAFDAVPTGNKNAVTIHIRNGVYKEKLFLDSTRKHVTLKGEDKFKTILTYDDHPGMNDASGKPINTQSSQSFMMKANHFTAINITFQNDAGFTAGQAVAVQVTGDMATFINCRFIGNQDVLYTNNPNSRQYYEDCYIEGTTDFIFGSSSVWFERCHIHSKKNSHITAASTPQEHAYGYVFNDCMLTGDTSLHSVSLGRPWRPFSSVTYMHCYMGQHIKATGWDNWGKTSNETTARYNEYENYGPGFVPKARANWSNQLNDSEAATITLTTVLRGWTPRGKV